MYLLTFEICNIIDINSYVIYNILDSPIILDIEDIFDFYNGLKALPLPICSQLSCQGRECVLAVALSASANMWYL